MKKGKKGPIMAMRPVVEGAADARKQREHKALESVGYRLENEADAILRKADHDMLRAIAENVQVLCEGFASLKMPSNDPEYLKRLQTNEAARNAIANRLTQIDLVPDGVKTYIGVGSFTHGDARELALLLSSHFEAKIRQHE